MKNKLFDQFLVFLICASAAAAQPAIKIDSQSQDLSSKFDYAFSISKSEKYFWIGYEIIRNDNRKIFSGTCYFDYDEIGINLRDIIENSKNIQSYKSSSVAKKKKYYGRSFRIENNISFNEGSEKETALLFLYDKNSKSIKDISGISVCSLDEYFDLQNYPLYWLGEIDKENSFDFVSALYKSASINIDKNELLAGIGIHTNVQRATTFLVDLSKNDNNEEIRKSSIFWLGLQNNSVAYNALKIFIYNDRNTEIKKSAVMSLGFINIPEATDELINIVKHNSEEELRKQAVYGLGNKAVKKAEEGLKNIIDNDSDFEIKKHAVYALANNSKNNISYLIDIAKNNSSLEIRKCAIWSLGNCNEKEAVDALIDLAKN